MNEDEERNEVDVFRVRHAVIGASNSMKCNDAALHHGDYRLDVHMKVLTRHATLFCHHCILLLC
jgi:hypothetical protein